MPVILNDSNEKQFVSNCDVAIQNTKNSIADNLTINTMGKYIMIFIIGILIKILYNNNRTRK